MIEINYINTKQNIGLKDWQTAWVLSRPYPTKLITETYRGALIFRLRGTAKRFSFSTIKKNLQKTHIIIEEENLPF
jgi:hypothetical protein